MINSFRNNFGNYLLRKQLRTVYRNRSMVNLAHAKRIGILYSLISPSDYKDVESFVMLLQKEHKEVKALGYVQDKEMVSQFLPKLSYDFFSQQELNWYHKPMNTRVNDFISTEYDLLIDLTREDDLPLKFIAGLSRARCKVGKFSEKNNSYYDLMIKADPSISVSEFIKQIQHYLTIIQQHE
ncbi:DUF6913 domain-containing protein [Bacteroidota bacterium]